MHGLLEKVTVGSTERSMPVSSSGLGCHRLRSSSSRYERTVSCDWRTKRYRRKCEVDLSAYIDPTCFSFDVIIQRRVAAFSKLSNFVCAETGMYFTPHQKPGSRRPNSTGIV